VAAISTGSGFRVQALHRSEPACPQAGSPSFVPPPGVPCFGSKPGGLVRRHSRRRLEMCVLRKSTGTKSIEFGSRGKHYLGTKLREGSGVGVQVSAFRDSASFLDNRSTSTAIAAIQQIASQRYILSIAEKQFSNQFWPAETAEITVTPEAPAKKRVQTPFLAQALFLAWPFAALSASFPASTSLSLYKRM
jgi:hypothetical protein